MSFLHLHRNMFILCKQFKMCESSDVIGFTELHLDARIVKHWTDVTFHSVCTADSLCVD